MNWQYLVGSGMFQDSEGKIPALKDGDPVGLWKQYRLLNGGWTLRRDPDLQDEILDAKGKPFAYIGTWDDPELLAAALAMTAAPELLAALEGVVRVADRATDEFDAARAAIKKARGEE